MAIFKLQIAFVMEPDIYLPLSSHKLFLYTTMVGQLDPHEHNGKGQDSVILQLSHDALFPIAHSKYNVLGCYFLTKFIVKGNTNTSPIPILKAIERCYKMKCT